MIYWVIGSIIIAIVLFVVWAMCKTAAAADKAEELMSDNL